MARNDSWSALGVVAALAARLDTQRTLLEQLLDEYLPAARMRPLEATYLAWIDQRAYGDRDPVSVARSRGRVWVARATNTSRDSPVTSA